MFKKYRLYIFAVLVFAAIIIFGLKCVAKQHYANEEKIEIPLPLKDTSEQILYRKGYTVSYNKDYKIPNWVAWHLTAEHATGPYHRHALRHIAQLLYLLYDFSQRLQVKLNRYSLYTIISASLRK